MVVKVTVNSPSKTRISINNQDRNQIRTVGITPEKTDTIAALKDVDASDPDNNETLIYDEASGKYVVKTLPIIDGGIF